MSMNEQPAPRLNLKMEVECRKNYARRAETARLKNISLTGAFLETENVLELAPEDKINVKVNVSGRQRDLAAKIIWISQSGCGIQFQPTNNRDIQIVDDLMYFVESRKESRRTVLDTIFKKAS